MQLSRWALAGFVFCLGMQNAPGQDQTRVYVGTYTSPTSDGVYLATLDLKTGKLGTPELAGKARNASFVALHPSKPLLYAVSEVTDPQGKPAGGVTAFKVETDGKLTKLNEESSQGAGPCHLMVDRSGSCVLVANYGGGSVAVLPLAADGSLRPSSCSVQHVGSSVNPQRQKGPHAHSIQVDPGNKFVLSADLGLDQLLVYQFDPQAGQIKTNNPAFASLAPGSGPRHFAFHPTGKYVFVNNEIASTVTAMTYDPERGALTEVNTLSTLPQLVEGNSTAETVVHPNGKFVYVSNRGHNTIAIFAIDPSNGKLTAAGHHSSGGKVPRNFNIEPTGQFLLTANQDSNNVVSLKIDATTGQLSDVGSEFAVGKPVCIKFAKP